MLPNIMRSHSARTRFLNPLFHEAKKNSTANRWSWNKRLTVESLEARRLLTTTLSPVYSLTPSGTEIDEMIDGASSRLTRTEDGIAVRADASQLEPGAYSMWWVVFNNPEFCAGTCRPNDFGIAEVEALATYADGAVVGEDGQGTFMAELKENDVSGVPEQFSHLPGAAKGLIDANKAEVHLVLRTHGVVHEDPELLESQITTLGGGCNPDCANVQGTIHDPPSAEVTISPIYTLNPTGTDIDQMIDGASSRLTRTEDGIAVRVDASELEPGAYTMWWVVFNNPEFCAGTCRPNDFGIAEVGALATYADGAVVGEDGQGTFMAELKENDVSGVPEQFSHLPGATKGLIDSNKAEVHLVLRTHSAAHEDPAVLEEQLTTLGGGCNPACANVQGAIHKPNNPIILGDANDDGRFNEADLVHVFQAGKYRTGEAADFSEGDWNGDGFFDTSDLVAAMKTGKYRAQMQALAAESVDLIFSSKLQDRQRVVITRLASRLDGEDARN